ncbi:hypothetical protein niasHT_014178 [Heterodera trifolii]|uniref:Uncharacterized protein n=1 Tax=Heterodera trifolii TaxID=157864 RepID=A0ABD2KX06_9BILA
MDEVAVHQDTQSMIAKMMVELKEVEKSLAQKLEIDQKLLVQIQRLDRPPSPWECHDEMQMMARLDHNVMSHGKIALIYLHACALRLTTELGILINELEEIGTEWTSADAIDEMLKSAAGLEMNRQAILKM